MTPRAWQLYDASWQLMYVLHKALEGLASLQGPAESAASKAARKPTGSLPGGVAHQPKGGSSSLGAMPFGLDRHLASLPVFAHAHGEEPWC